LRNIKDRKYSLYRFDVLFSETKFIDLKIIENGGWHFTNIKTPEDIKNKFSNFLHHQEFEASGLMLDDIKKMVNMKKVIYDHSVDQRGYKWRGDTNLKKCSFI
jgi:beta-1,4-mannosyl-glycoprotein beta-1,4-N-acetylglucosaminyltransferase